MVSGIEMFIIVVVAVGALGLSGGILWLAYLAYIGKFSRTHRRRDHDRKQNLHLDA